MHTSISQLGPAINADQAGSLTQAPYCVGRKGRLCAGRPLALAQRRRAGDGPNSSRRPGM